MSSLPAAKDELRAAIASIIDEDDGMKLFSADFTLERYLIANKLDVSKSLSGIKETAKWRQSAIIPGFVCELCRMKPGSHCFISLGLDAGGSTLIYGCPARASEGGEVEATMAHCVNTLEKQWGEVTGPSPPQDWVWMVDFRGFGVSHALQARLGMSFASIFRSHFPERLKSIILLNPPILFKALVAAIGAVADARTLAKLKVVVAPDHELCEKLKSEFGVNDPEVLAWLNTAFSTPPTPGSLPPLPKHLEHLQV